MQNHFRESRGRPHWGSQSSRLHVGWLRVTRCHGYLVHPGESWSLQVRTGPDTPSKVASAGGKIPNKLSGRRARETNRFASWSPSSLLLLFLPLSAYLSRTQAVRGDHKYKKGNQGRQRCRCQNEPSRHVKRETAASSWGTLPWPHF